MLNQVVLVGRLTGDLDLVESENGTSAVLELAIQKSIKNKDGEYETDLVKCVLTGEVAKNTAEFCHKGDIIGVKGRLQVDGLEKEDGTMTYFTRVMAEKVTFLSSRKPEEEEC
ncbi:MAG: single-stranded DNA-binding protein [Cytophagales bacterium]|nr:single-stranded DNA-binding protein [Cytophagales bacterium]